MKIFVGLSPIKLARACGSLSQQWFLHSGRECLATWLDGFAFVFPLGSSLVPDVSRSILKLTEGDLMKELENKWFGNETTCSNSDPMVSDSSSLGLDRFWGLFLIVGVASLLALIIFIASFLCSYGHILMTKGIRAMLRVYDGKDLSSHTFRNNKLGDEPLTSCSSCPPSPSNLSYSDGKDITDLGEERMDAREDDSPAIDELDLRDQKC
ncbi:hypothetical protein M0R45_008556 [Rubus argutus]|uniref:Uncharacterized protein n=1 Tax=Rubus argutus TaxID=59490 RepID=A0AAW1Y4S5_RUBAR